MVWVILVVVFWRFIFVFCDLLLVFFVFVFVILFFLIIFIVFLLGLLILFKFCSFWFGLLSELFELVGFVMFEFIELGLKFDIFLLAICIWLNWVLGWIFLFVIIFESRVDLFFFVCVVGVVWLIRCWFMCGCLFILVWLDE